MKNKIISLIAIVATLALMIFATVKVSNNVTNVEVQKAKGDETIETGNQIEGENAEEEKTYSFSMILNQIDKADKVNMGGNKVAITSENESVTFEVFDAITNTRIDAVEDKYTLPENGARLQISGIKEGERNNLIIENKEAVENYVETFKKLTVEIDSSDIDSIRVAIKDITKLVNGEEVTQAGSEDETATFIYQEEDGTVKINNNSDLKIYYAFVANSDLAEGKTGLTDAELENVEWNEYNKETGYKAEKNGIIYSKTKYKDGAYSKINNYVVNNVDKIAPIITLNDVDYNTSEYTAKISGEIEDGEATKDYAKSGLVGYAITTEDEEPENYLEFEDEENEEKNIELSEIDVNGTYYVWTKDKAGNVTKRSVEVDIDFTTTEDEETKRVLILSAPNADLVGTTYVSINEFLDALEENNITAESGRVVAQIVNEIKSETATFKDKDIVLDLNGYSITGRVQNPTFKIESGKLNVVDNKYDIAEYISDEEKANELKTKYQAKDDIGKVVSLKTNAIEINDGVFTLGENENVSSIPNKVSPKIEANNKGIYNKNGDFNYYDGVIVGKITVDGTISDTPKIYDPATTGMENDDRKQTVLERVSGIEALIGKTRYMTLEEAIFAANNLKGTSEEQIEIDIVKDLAKNQSVVIDNTKNIKLDFNGFKLSGSSENYTLINNGKLELYDSEGTSLITGARNKVIYNSSEAYLNNNGVNIKITKEESYVFSGAIVNDVNGTLDINAGTITSEVVFSPAVYNNGGTLNVNGGKIVSTDRGYVSVYYKDYNGMGILNVDKELDGELIAGKLNVTGGNFVGYCNILSDSNFSEVNINGGLFESEGDEKLNIVQKSDISNINLNGNAELKGLLYNCGDSNIVVDNAKRIYKAANIKNGKIIVNGGVIDTLEDTNYMDDWTVNGAIEVNGGEIHDILNGTKNLDVKNALITGTIYPRKDVNKYLESLSVTIDNTTFKKKVTSEVDYFIENSVGAELSITNTNMYAAIDNKREGYYGGEYSFYGINNTGKNDVVLENVNMNIINYTDDERVRNIYGIYNTNEGDIFITGKSSIITGGAAENINTNDYAIYNDVAGEIIIGDKDQVYNENDIIISSCNQAIKGKRNKISLYDGKILGKTTIEVTIHDIEEGYQVNKTSEELNIIKEETSDLYNKDDSTSRNINLNEIKLGDRSNNVEVVQTSTQYKSIGEAIQAVGDNKYTIRIIADELYETAIENNVIENTQEIELDLNGKNLYLGNGFINKGKFKIVDNSGTNNSNIRTSEINNLNEMEFNAGNWIVEVNPNYGIKNCANANMKLANSSFKLDVNGQKDNWVNIFKNEGYLEINENSNIDIVNYTYWRAILNEGKLVINDGIISGNNGKEKYYRLIENIKQEDISDFEIQEEEKGSMQLINGAYDFKADAFNSAWGILEIDLSEKNSQDVYTVLVNAFTSSDNGEKSYIYVKESKDKPDLNDDTGRLLYATGITKRNDNRIYVEGGKKYYLHFIHSVQGIYSYRKALSVNYIKVFNDNEEIYSTRCGETIINGGTIINDENEYYGYSDCHIGIYNNGYGTKTVINDGIIKSSVLNENYSDRDAIYNYDGTVEINGGKINNETKGIVNINGIINITGGKAENIKRQFIYQKGIEGEETAAETTITNGDIQAEYSVVSDIGKVNISDSKFLNNFVAMDFKNTVAEVKNVTASYKGSYSQGIKLEGNTDVKVLGDSNTFSAESDFWTYGIGASSGDENNKLYIENLNINVSGLSGIGLNLSGKNEILIDNIKIVTNKTMENQGESIGINNSGSGSLKINNCDIEAKGPGNSVNVYGLKSIGALDLTLGTNEKEEDEEAEDNVDITKPKICGKDYGLYKQDGNWYFYDGIIKATEGTAYYGEITKKPNHYEVVREAEEGYNEVAYLKDIPIVLNVDTNKNYYSLQEAFDDCVDNEETNLKLLYDVNPLNSSTISENKKINFDLNSHMINTTATAYLINNGSLKIHNGTIELKSNGTEDNWINAIENNGYFEINEGSVINIEKYNYCRAILNYGKVVVNDGIIKGLNTYYDLIKNSKKSGFDNITVRIPEGRSEEKNYYKNINGYWKLAGEYNCQVEAIYEIDLTSKDNQTEYNVLLNAFYNSRYPNQKKAHAYITESVNTPNTNSENGRIFELDESTESKDYTISVNGGKKYYLHLLTDGDSSYVGGLYVNYIKVYNENEDVYYTKCGEVEINNGTLENKDNGPGRHSALNNDGNGCKITINGGKIQDTKMSYTRGIYNNKGYVKITGGELNNQYYAIDNYNGIIDILGGSASNVGWYFIQQKAETDNSVVDVTSPKTTMKDYTISNANSVVDSNVGEVIANNIVVNKYGTGFAFKDTKAELTKVDLELGEEAGYNFGYKLLGNTDINFIGNENKIAGNTIYSSYGIHVEGDNNKVDADYLDIEIDTNYNTRGIELTKATNTDFTFRDINLVINGNTLDYIYGIQSVESTGSIKVEKGNIISNGKETSERSYGIYSSSGMSFVLGVNEKENNNEAEYNIVDSPVISGTTYGIYKSEGELHMYDGIIRSKEGKALYGAVSSKPKDYELEISNSEEFNEIGRLNKFYIAEIVETEQKYYDLQDAFNACEDNRNLNVRLLADYNVTEKIVIGNNKNIIFDLNEKTLYVSNDRCIVNEGKATLKNGTIRLYNSGTSDKYNNAFENNGECIIEENISINIKDYLNCRAILNRNKINVEDILINGSSNVSYNSYTELVKNQKEEELRDFELRGNGSVKYENGLYKISAGRNEIEEAVLEIDLTSKDVSKVYNVLVNGFISTFGNNVGYGYLTEDSEMPDLNSESNRLFKLQNTTLNSDYQVSVNGGKKYYLHLIYDCKNYNSTQNSLNINYVKVFNEDEIIYQTKCGEFTVNGGTFTLDTYYGNSKAFKNEGTGSKIIINNATVNATNDFKRDIIAFENNNGEIVINDITVTNYMRGINNYNGEVEINGGSFSELGDILIYSENNAYEIAKGKININNWNVDVNDIKLMNILSGEVNYNGGNAITNNIGIYVEKDATVNVTGGTIESRNNDAINIARGNVKLNVIGGTIISDLENGININNKANCDIVLGKLDESVSITDPKIQAAKVGINRSNGRLEFYDGVVSGDVEPITGTIDARPEFYRETIDGNSEYLIRDADFENTFYLDGAYYASIDLAIDHINESSSKKGVIYIGRDYVQEEQIVIPEGIDVTIALQGHVIEFDCSVGIKNNGTLKIIDTDIVDDYDVETSSTLKNENGVVINNNGTLIIGMDSNPNSNSPIVSGLTPVTGNEPTILSGETRVLNVQTGSLNINNGIQMARFNFGGNYNVNTTEFSTKNIAKRIYLEGESIVSGITNRILSAASRITGNPELPTYTNDGVSVNIDADVIPNLDMYYTDTNVGKVKVKHVDIKTNKVLSESETEDKHGRPYETHSIDIEGYDLVEKETIEGEEVSRLPENSEGTYDALNEIEVVYYYVSKAEINIKYLDVETNEEIFESEYVDGHEGDTYQVTNRNIDGYMLVTDRLPENSEGTFKVTRDEENNITNREEDVVYYYTNKSVGLNVKYVDIVHDSIIYNYHVDGIIGERYNIVPKTKEELEILNGYNLVEEKEEISYMPENSEGVFTDELIEVTYYFVHDYRFEVHYLDEEGNDISEAQLIDTYEGERYIASAIDINDYVLKEGQEEQTGTLLRDDTKEDKYSLRIDFVYEPLVVICDVKVKHVDEKTNKVLKEETIRGERNTEYNTSADRFAKYDLDEERIPENKEGTFKENETIEVTYYYKRMAYVKVNYLDVDTKEEVFESEYYEGHEDEGYEVFNRNIDNYILVTEDEEGNSLLPTNAKGTYTIIRDDEGNITNDEIEVTYYYTNKVNNIVVKYVDIVHDSEIYSYQVEGILGERYNIIPETSENREELKGYNLVEEKDGISYTPENSEGIVTENGAEIVFFYVHNYRFEVHYVDEEGNDIEEPILIDTLEGERYNAEAIEIEDKELVGEINTYSGVLEKDTAIAEEDVNPVYGRYFLRINFVYKDKEKDPEPENITVNNTTNDITNEVTNEIENTIENEIVNNTVENNTIVNNTIENEIVNNTVENETTNEIENTVDNEIVNNTVENNTVVNNTTNEVENIIDNEIINNTIENETVNNTIENIIDNEVENKVSNEINNEIPEDKEDKNKKDFKVIVHYVDKSTGKKITTDVVIEGRTGEDYLTKVKELKGYELISKPSNYKGQMIVQIVDGKETKEIHVTYYYAKKATGVLPQTGEEIMRNTLFAISFIACITLAVISINQIKKEEKNDK